MRVVVMDEDMREPITVVDIPPHLMREVEQRKRPWVNLHVPTTMAEWVKMTDKTADILTPEIEHASLRIVRLKMEPIYKGHDVLHWVAVPDDPTLALLLRAAFLPGQATELRRQKALSWFQGAIAAAG